MAANAGRICKLCGQFAILRTLKKSSKCFSFFSFQSNNPAISCLTFNNHYFGTFSRQFHTDDLDKNPSSPITRLQEDLEDIKLLLEKRLSKDEKTKNPQQQLQLVDELIRRRLNPNEGDIKFDALASKMKPEELYNLGTNIWSLQNIVGKEAVNTSMPLFRVAAMFGECNAKYTYGQLLFRGAGGLKADPIEASQMFQELSREGHPQAQFTLAGMYYSGYGVDQNFETSYTLYQISSENGVVQSLNALGKMYLNGEGVEKDEEKAMTYFMKGAEKNDAQACMSIAHCYNHAKGVEENFDEAFAYHKKAAELGYPPGIYNVATHYFAGKGVGMDMKKAAEYFHIAADQGFTLAQVNLGNMYYQGLGVERDVEKARQFYQTAAPTNRNARLLLEELEMDEQKLKEEKVDEKE